jgi:hypothetical protein
MSMHYSDAVLYGTSEPLTRPHSFESQASQAPQILGPSTDEALIRSAFRPSQYIPQ